MSQGEFILSNYLKELTWSPPEERQSDADQRGGSGQVITFGRPYWRIRFIYDNQNDAAYRAQTAWLARRKGSRVTFTANRPGMRKPLLAPGMTNEGLSVVAVNIAAGTVTIGGLGTNPISAGDMLSYYTANSGYWVGQALADAAPVTGQAVISVHPPPQTPHASTPVPRLVDAIGEFKLVGRIQNTERHTRRASVSFEAVQVVR